MKMLLKAILRAVRRAMRAAARAARGVGGFVGGLVDGLFAGPYVEEVEEDDETILVEDQAARQETTEAVSRKPDVNRDPAPLVMRAVELRSAGQACDRVFDLEHPAERRLLAYVQALDESGLRAIRCMPLHTLARHLEEGPFCAAGLRPVGRTIEMKREEAEKAKAPPAPRARRRSGNVVSEAVASGRRMTLDEVVSASRRRAA